MSVPTGDDAAIVLLRSLPAEIAESLLDRLDSEAAVRLRARLEAAEQLPVTPEQFQAVIKEFFDLDRIAARVPSESSLAGEYSSKAPPPKADVNTNPIQALQEIDLARLVRVLQEEQAPTVSIVMASLDAKAATEVMKRLPAQLRPDVAIRLAQPGPRNPALLERIVRAVVVKAQKLADVAPEPTSADRDKNLAMILRALNRSERKEIMDALQQSDPESAARVGALLFQFEDLLRVEDRELQTVLVELDMKTLAMALKPAPELLVAKVSANISSRARDMLNEEMGLLGSTPASRVLEAQQKVVTVLRQFEQEGKIVLQEE